MSSKIILEEITNHTFRNTNTTFRNTNTTLNNLSLVQLLYVGFILILLFYNVLIEAVGNVNSFIIIVTFKQTVFTVLS